MRAARGGALAMSDRNGLNILVIDDEATQRLLAKEFLEDAGHHVTVTEDGKRGQKLALSLKPDLILLDYLLPAVDGNSVCRTLKTNPATAEIPVILVTASRDADVIENALAAGAEDFVTKPVDWAYLPDRVANVVKRTRERQDLHRQLGACKIGGTPPAVPQMSRDFEHQLDSMVRECELQSEQIEAACRAHTERVEAERDAAIARAVEQTRRSMEAEFAASQAAASQTLQLALSEATTKHELEVRALCEQHARELQRAESKVEASLREAWSRDIAELKMHQARSLEETAARFKSITDQTRVACEQEREAESRRYALERESLRGALAKAQEKVRAAETKAEQLAAACENRIQAAWSLCFQTAVSQATLVNYLLSGGAGDEFQRSAQALAALTVKFRGLATAMLATASPQVTELCVSSVIDRILAEVQPVAAERRIKVVTAPVDPGMRIASDKALMRHALMCLLVNAIRFTPPGGTVEIRTVQGEDASVQVSISDNGVGMPPGRLQELQCCLDRPSQRSAQRADDNAGLGIPTVQAIARKLGARFTLDSKMGHGTVASLDFPPSANATVQQRAAI